MANRPISIGTQFGQGNSTWQENREAWIGADELGLDYIFNCDHFFPGQEEGPFFEAWSMVAAFAEVTKNAKIGILVAGNSYRNPNLTADIARTVDHISGGRTILGIGSGWSEKDYVDYGYEFGTPASRLKDLARDLPIIKDRLGKLNPGPVNGHLPILIGGSGEKVTLRLVAEYADIWHAGGDLETLKRKSAILDDWCAKVGRDPSEIERSTSIPVEKFNQADAYVEAGFTLLLGSGLQPKFNLEPLRELIAWRDARNGA